MVKIRADAQSLDFGTLVFSKVCVVKFRKDVQSLDFGTLGFCKSLHGEKTGRMRKV